ncbi:MAG: LacI family transcriptional regulator [Clostridiales bacterium]|jgi:DNA-binding LacI/PurR family transcriptional regulator|nr:LacI family transcriptional regulator [Clostridiales bacterium]
MTIQDVAKQAKLSSATISRVLNNDSCVSAKTRERVERTIKELGYVPNLLGRNLRREKTNVFYVLLPSIENPFYSAIVQGIEEEARETDYSVMLCETYNDDKRFIKYAAAVRNKLADGIILVSPMRNAIRHFRDIPLVICGESDASYDCIQVDIDNKLAAIDAVNHLLGLGKKNIALISGSYASGSLREAGYKAALESAGLELKEELICKDCYHFEHGYNAAMKLMRSGVKVDGIFATVDLTALGAIRALGALNIKIPEEVAVIGFDDLMYSRMNNPSLSTIKQPCGGMGHESFRLLYERINGDSGKNNLVLQHKVIARESTIGSGYNVEEGL